MSAMLIAAGLALALPAQAAAPQAQFFEALQTLCDRSFEGRMVTSDPADAAFAGQELVMGQVRCEPNEIRIPFRVGEDRSRTWVIGRLPEGLRLKHDHRHADGTEDAVSQYGGETTAPGDGSRQEFPVDAFSKALFEREGRAVSTTNVWAVEITPKQLFAYELRRPGRFFRVEFDLSRPAS